MQTLRITAVVFAVMFMILFTCKKAFPQQTPRINKNNFYIGSQGNIFPEYYPQFKALNFNTMVDWGLTSDFQKYEDWMGNNNRIYGGFFDAIDGASPSFNPYLLQNRLPDGYITGEKYFLTQWHSNINNSDAGSVFWGSARIYRPCMGQRSTYEAEDNSLMITKKPGYGFEYTDMVNSDYDDNWQGQIQRVKYCVKGTNQAGYVTKKLYENNEQSDVVLKSQTAYLYSDRKESKEGYRWYIKPRLRIDSVYAKNPANNDRKIVRVEIYNYSGKMLSASKDITAGDFLDKNGNYDGRYIENFEDKLTGLNILSVLADSLTMGADTVNYYSKARNSKIDYRIWWYGETDIWLDYVRVDDEWAHFLFTDPYGEKYSQEINPYRFGTRIREEAQLLKETPGFAYFYIDEFYYNNIPCIAEVNRIIEEYDKSGSLVVMSNPGSPALKNKPSTGEIYQYCRNMRLYDNFIFIDPYPVFWNQHYPPNLSIADSIAQRYNAVKLWSANRAPDAETYNYNLNNFYEKEWIYGPYEAAAELVKQSQGNTVLAGTIQVHSVESNIARINCGDTASLWEFRREPTNEEISMQVYYSMSWGAKHIHYFQQWSGESERICNGITERYYDQGITGHFLAADNTRLPRYLNYFGQRKWDFLVKLNNTVMNLGNYMYNLSDLKYEGTISVHKDGFITGFIKNLESYPVLTTTKNTYNADSPDSNKFWQIGYFSNPVNPTEKYFLILNMRCTPEFKPGNDGDFRCALVFLNSAYFESSTRWMVSNPLSEEPKNFTTADLSKGILLPGIFNPGEGKLFKIEPLD